jgi:hypothetical protein
VQIYSKETVTKHDEARDVHQSIRVEVLQLYLPLVQQPEQERLRRVPKTALVEHKEAYDLVGFGLWLLVLHRGALKCANAFGGNNPFTVKSLSCGSSMVDDLQFDITPTGGESGTTFLLSPSFSLSLPLSP